MGELNLEEQTQFAGQQKGEKGDARNTELNKAGHTSTSQRLLRAGCAAVFHGSPHLTVTQYYKRGTILSSFKVTCPVLCSSEGKGVYPGLSGLRARGPGLLYMPTEQ